MAIPATEISVTAPVGQAYERVKQMLFRPFDIGKWFVIGFCAWLATLGESGSNFNFRFGGGGPGGPPGNFRTIRDAMDQAMRYVQENLYWIIPAAVGLIVLCWLWGSW